MLEFWPIILVAGGGLVAWGRMHATIEDTRKDVDKKASAERVDAIDSKLDRIDGKLDRLVETLIQK